MTSLSKIKKKIVIVGASVHGRVVADIISKQLIYSLIGYIDIQKDKSIDLGGYKILGTEDEILDLSIQYNFEYVVIAIGDNNTRNLVASKIKKVWPNVIFATCIHPSSVIGNNVTIGAGSVVMAGAIINPFTAIGEHCIINTKSSIDHDNTIGNFVSLAPNSTTGGNVKIGDFSVIGLSASIIHGKNIGENTVVGAGSLILHNHGDNIVVYGTPGRLIKTRNKSDKYL